MVILIIIFSANQSANAVINGFEIDDEGNVSFTDISAREAFLKYLKTQTTPLPEKFSSFDPVSKTLNQKSDNVIKDVIEDQNFKTSSQKMLERTVRIGSVGQDGHINSFCSGVITSNGEVTTAAHCFADPKGKSNPINGAFAAQRLVIEIYDPVTKKRKVVPAASGNIIYDHQIDLARIKVNTGPKNYPPLDLDTTKCSDGAILAAGFGDTGHGMSDKLRAARLSRISNEDEAFAVINSSQGENFRRYPRMGRAPRPSGTIADLNVIGGFRGGGQICPGDSGGPIYCLRDDKVSLLGISTTGHDGRIQPGTPPYSKRAVCQSHTWMSGTSSGAINQMLGKWRTKDKITPRETSASPSDGRDDEPRNGLD